MDPIFYCILSCHHWREAYSGHHDRCGRLLIFAAALAYAALAVGKLLL